MSEVIKQGWLGAVESASDLMGTVESSSDFFSCKLSSDNGFWVT
jgi:hypothetical protein